MRVHKKIRAPTQLGGCPREILSLTLYFLRPRITSRVPVSNAIALPAEPTPISGTVAIATADTPISRNIIPNSFSIEPPNERFEVPLRVYTRRSTESRQLVQSRTRDGSTRTK